MSQSVSNAAPDAQAGQDRPKRARRTRKDCDQRTFVCKLCQRTYLSNAALYTHVKNKHQGEKQKLQSPQKQKQQKQNKKQESKNQIQQQQHMLSGQQNSDKQNKQEGIDANSSALQQLRQYMKRYYPQRNKNCTIRLICQGLHPDIHEYIQPLLRQGLELKNMQVNKAKLTINQVFGIFLSLMNLRVSSTCINFLIRFFFYFHKALISETKKSDYCKKQNSSNLPNYFNNIILHDRIPASGFDEDQIMHNPIIICKVFQYFGLWLYDQRYTDYQAIANFSQQE